MEKQHEGLGRADLRCGDCLEVLRSIPDESVRLVVTSPPYNIGKEYEQDRRLTLDEYKLWLDEVISELAAKVVQGGSVCWQVGNFVKDKEVYPLDIIFYESFKKLGLKLRNRIIWHFNFGLHATTRFSGRYETLLWFTKGENYVFNLDPVRVPQLYPGKRHSSKRQTKAGQISGNPLGKNPSDFWEFSASEFFEKGAIWNLPNVKSNHPEKTVHPCQFPVELAERCVLALTNSGDTVLDPFVGVGTTVIAAVKHGRNGLGVDKDSRYVAIANERLDELRCGSLKLRPIGAEVRKPKHGEKVATVPIDWLGAAE